MKEQLDLKTVVSGFGLGLGVSLWIVRDYLPKNLELDLLFFFIITLLLLLITYKIGNLKNRFLTLTVYFLTSATLIVVLTNINAIIFKVDDVVSSIIR